MKNSIVIFTAKKARELLRQGYTIIDILPDKNDPDNKRSVFVFQYTNGMLEEVVA